MQAVHEGTSRVDRGLNIGLHISLPREEVPSAHIDPQRAFEFHYFFMRKFWFMNLAQAVVAFPGGYGTLDELFEVLTLTQTGKSRGMPVFLFDRGFWTTAVNFEELAARGYIDPTDDPRYPRLFRIVDTVDEAFAAVTAELG
jgi:uncharacterized protein (TIGR00730 family)